VRGKEGEGGEDKRKKDLSKSKGGQRERSQTQKIWRRLERELKKRGKRQFQ